MTSPERQRRVALSCRWRSGLVVKNFCLDGKLDSFLCRHQTIQYVEMRAFLREEGAANGGLAHTRHRLILKHALIGINAVFLTLLQGFQGRGIAEQLRRSLDRLGPSTPHTGILLRLATQLVNVLTDGIGRRSMLITNLSQFRCT